MFTIEGREAIRAALVEAARHDNRITGAALVGSASVGTDDRWSDIDLSFGVRPGVELAEVLLSFTERMTRDYTVVDTLDAPQGEWLQRVFLLDNTLQVDLAFASEAAFRAGSATFALLFGNSAPALPGSIPDPAPIVGWAWLDALHVRAALARNKRWQAELMVSAMRDKALALAALRHGVDSCDGKGLDALPKTLLAVYEETLVRSLEPEELHRAFRATTNLLIREIESICPDRAERLGQTLRRLDDSCTVPDSHA